MKKEIKILVQQAIEKLLKDKGLSSPEILENSSERSKRRVAGEYEVFTEFLIEIPEKEIHGDYSVNIAFILAKTLKQKPMKIAKDIVQRIEKEIKKEKFKKIEAIKPGFINFWLSEQALINCLEKILLEKEKYGQISVGKNKKIQVEFISANPTGPLTIGNARGGFFGDVLGNVFKKAGFRVEKAYYINDYGMQILFLGHSVLKDGKAKYKGDYINKLNKKIKEKDPYKAGEKAAKIIIKEIIKKTINRMGIKYDEWFSEASLYESKEVDRVLAFLKKKKMLYEKEGAVWFKSSKYEDERDRVIVKTDKQKTYLAGDIAYHRYKFEKKKFESSKVG